MGQKVSTTLQNNFTGGLKTEFTGLNFPVNACTDTDNCIFSMVGDVLRREGIDFEANYQTNAVNRTNVAVSSYRWLNAGGDGNTQILVLQIGGTLYFYESSNTTSTSPISAQLLTSTLVLSGFLPTGSSNVPDALECQFSEGNGYLFVYHPHLDPICCTFAGGSITGAAIPLQIRDFVGIPEPGVPTSFRPTMLTNEHSYNLQNQGWTDSSLWSVSSATNVYSSNFNPAGGFIPTGPVTFTVPASVAGITAGNPVLINFFCLFNEFDISGGSFEISNNAGAATGVVLSYSGTTLVINISSCIPNLLPGVEFQSFISVGASISASNTISTINTWQTATGNYPSNADVWWLFKDSTGVFNPTTQYANIDLPNSPSAKGHFILNAFDQEFSTVSGVPSLTSVTTSLRPRTGTWFAGRVWYTGVDAVQAASGDQNTYTWTENIYFSQIITDSTQFGMCYQTNDPTDENLFNLLPSDGGVVSIQGCGSIYKLFPIQNGMLVFASNGIWFITGSQGIGFTANDYTITKISAVQSISSTSFVSVNGLPIFWNEEGIYNITPAQQGLGLTVNPITVGTILSFYNSIPAQSKKYARGAYHPIDYIVQWTYRSTVETDITSRYSYDSILALNTATQAFYPYSITGTPLVNGVVYVSNPSASAPEPVLKYIVSYPHSGSYNITFAEERDPNYVDWYSYDTTGVNYTSYFVTGYAIPTQGLRQYQPDYVMVFSRGGNPNAYTIQGIWDFSTSGNSGKQSAIQKITLNKPYFGMVYRKHRIRGHGLSLQLKFSSVANSPFDIMGWSTWNTENMSI